MSSYRLYFHLVWTTHDRLPMIDGATQTWLDGYIRRTAIAERVEVIVLAILRTHVHLLIRTGPRFDFARLAQLIKGGSSHAVNRLPENKLGLRWAREYSATTVSPRSLQQAIRYIEEQEGHHPGEAIPR